MVIMLQLFLYLYDLYHIYTGYSQRNIMHIIIICFLYCCNSMCIMPFDRVDYTITMPIPHHMNT